MPRTLNPKLRAWSQAVKEAGVKPPIRKGTAAYDKVKAIADRKLGVH